MSNPAYFRSVEYPVLQRAMFKLVPVALVALSLACPANAAATVQDTSGVIEEVVVTGTWIPGTPEDDPLPVTRITRDDLRAQGSPGVIDLLRNLSFSQGADGESDQYGTRTGADRATVNLRGLGPSRSLVLLNSRRMTWSPGSIPDQAQLLVDVNLLPAAALDRIEVLRDGAAATYGSDAIAGVLNFITRSDFEGIELETRHKFIDGSNGDDRLAVVAGRVFGSGATSIVTSIGVQRRAPLPMVARDWTVRSYAENPRGGWSGTGTPAIFVPLAAFAQTARDASAMRAVSIVDPNCENLGGAHTNAPPDRPEGGVCRFQYTPLVNLVQETLRWQWFTQGHREFDNGLRFSGELLVARTEVPSWKTSPSYPPSEVIDLSRVIQARHPALVDMAARYPPPVRRLRLVRRRVLPLARRRRRTGRGGHPPSMAERGMDQRTPLRSGGASAGTSASLGNRACRHRGRGRLGSGILERGAHLCAGLSARGGRRWPPLPQRTGAPGTRRLRLRSAGAQRVR